MADVPTLDVVPRPRVVDLPGLPPPVGLYSHAVAVPVGAQLVTIAGQLAVDAEGEPIDGDFADQFHAVVGALDAVLQAMGTDLAAVCKFTTYLIDPDDIAPFYEERAKVWPRWWPDGRAPANTLLVVQRLVRPELRIEIEAIAVVPPLREDTNHA
ncbi:MAG: hypothetical protein JWN46_3820 [Acidimicrobiales bacterium]|nr:hypothetical protein [Acidimicrobiales bacterium]